MTETMSVAEYRALIDAGKGNKFNARRCVSSDGHAFDSIAEKNYYERYLLPLLHVSEVYDLELQPRFVLQEAFADNKGVKRSPITYTADFAFQEAGNPCRVVVDVKGKRTEAFGIRWRLALCRFPELDWRIIEAAEWGAKAR